MAFSLSWGSWRRVSLLVEIELGHTHSRRVRESRLVTTLITHTVTDIQTCILHTYSVFISAAG